MWGGGGQVYKGRHQDTDEPVAIKEVSLSKVRRRSPEFAARHQQNLRNETECLRSLSHPNIVRLLGAPPLTAAAAAAAARPPAAARLLIGRGPRAKTSCPVCGGGPGGTGE